MLERISWANYWAAIIIVLAIYYFIVLLLLYQKGFFKNNFKTVSPKTRSEKNSSADLQPNLFGFESAPVPEQEKATVPPVEDKFLMPLVHDLVKELQQFISGIAERSFIKEEVIMGMQVIVKNYKKLEGSSYTKSVNDFIKNEVEDFCSMHLSEDDIRRVWLG